MRERRQNTRPESSRADSESDRELVEFESRAIQKSGYSRTFPLPKQGLSNLDLDSGDRLVPLIDPERGELILRPQEEE